MPEQAARQVAGPLHRHTHSPRRAARQPLERKQIFDQCRAGGTAGGEAATHAHARESAANAHAFAKTGGVAVSQEAAALISAAAGGTAGGTAAANAHALAEGGQRVAAASEAALSDRAASGGTAGGEAAAQAHALAKVGGVAAAREAAQV